MKALGQPPGPDGVRRRRQYIIRNTYDDLNRTTVKTWLDWWQENKVGPLKRSKPMVHEIVTDDLHWEVVFLALDSPDDVKKLLSAEPSDIWFNEAREIPRELIDAGIGRIGRYPRVDMGGCFEPQVLLDTNAPGEDHFISIMADLVPFPENLSESERLSLTRPDNWSFHVQPPGVIERVDDNGQLVGYDTNPKAENLKYLPANYYVDRAKGKTREWVRVEFMVKPGTLTAGRAVWPEFKEDWHVSKEPLEAAPGHPILIGLDFGRTPAAIIGQRVFDRWRVLEEFLAEDMGARGFARILKRHLSEEYPGHKFALWGDPAGAHLAEADDISPFMMFRAEGLDVVQAPSNDPVVRIEAVKEILSQAVDGRPRFLLSPRARILKAAMSGGYQYKRMKVSGERYGESPDKNRYSHPADALQYLVLGAGEGRMALHGNRERPQARVAQRPASVFERHKEPRASRQRKNVFSRRALR
jgi:hypothetical protein